MGFCWVYCSVLIKLSGFPRSSAVRRFQRSRQQMDLRASGTSCAALNPLTWEPCHIVNDLLGMHAATCSCPAATCSCPAATCGMNAMVDPPGKLKDPLHCTASMAMPMSMSMSTCYMVLRNHLRLRYVLRSTVPSILWSRLSAWSRCNTVRWRPTSIVNTTDTRTCGPNHKAARCCLLNIGLVASNSATVLRYSVSLLSGRFFPRRPGLPPTSAFKLAPDVSPKKVGRRRQRRRRHLSRMG